MQKSSTPTKNARRSPFRESAMRQYIQRREQDTLPRVVSPPFFICCWLLLILLMIGGALAWFAQVPTYEPASGVVMAQAKPANSTQAVIFFPAGDANKLHVGQLVQVKVGDGTQLQSKVTQIQSGTLSPNDVRTRFSTARVIPDGPSVVITAALDSSITTKFAGSTVDAQVQVGSQSVLSQLWSN